VADILIRDYSVVNALNLDGGGSTTLAMENPATHVGELVNVSDDNPQGRYVGSNLAIFANPIQK
jgi:exopolysaccharide biosynthesis protein